MSYNVLKLCKKMEGYYEVDPAVMFPATVKRIQEVVAGEPPTEIVTPGWKGRPDREPVADKFLKEAESFPAEAWSLALVPFAKDHSEVRARALAFAEGWFKRALALAVKEEGKGVRIHISRNPDYKR